MFHCFIVNKIESHAKLRKAYLLLSIACHYLSHVFSTRTLQQAVSKKKTLAKIRKHYYWILSLTLKRFLQAEVQIYIYIYIYIYITLKIYKHIYVWSEWWATACYHVRINLQKTILAKLYRLIHYISGHWKVCCLIFTKK